jgi:hypothetical protein
MKQGTAHQVGSGPGQVPACILAAREAGNHLAGMFRFHDRKVALMQTVGDSSKERGLDVG